jgi:aldehyde:ferredoxin oxidoreductase
MHGWTGRILLIDLSLRSNRIETPSLDIYKKNIGGKGLAGHYLERYAHLDWNDPLMPLLIFTGPLVATPSPASGRICVMSRSPQTGTVGDASVGGSFGTELKNAGWDGICITGVCDSWTGIEISDNRIIFASASEFTGQDISASHAALKAKGSTAIIGRAAENSVLFSGMVFDGHYSAGRNGLGMAAASKKLKYITVKGTGSVSVYDHSALKKVKEDVVRLLSASPVIMGETGIANFGTGALYDLTSSRRMMPTDNFRKTWFSEARSLNSHAYSVQYRPKKTGCRGCPVMCKKITADGRALPEFETMNHFSALLSNADISVVMDANTICNESGMDTISAGSTLACYAEIENRQLTGAEIISLLNDIAHARGIGKELSKGSFIYAKSMGKPWASMSVKSLELPAYDPRGACGMALGYAVSTRGGCHLRAYPIGTEILRKPVPTDRFSFAGKAGIVKIAEDMNAAVDSLTSCRFFFLAVSLEEYSKIYTSITGIETSGQELLKIGEMIYFRDRIINTRNGFTSADDDLPSRFFTEEGTHGNSIEVRPLDRDDFLKARSEYYEMRGLDENGIPLHEKAQILGLVKP